MSEHTPGPWWVEERGGKYQVMAAHRGPGSSYCICEVNFWEDPQENARLMAAAPDLLDALENALAELSPLMGAYRPEHQETICGKAREAIAKARGIT